MILIKSHYASVVQEPHNFWPQSQMHISSLLDDPLPPKSHRNPDISNKIDHDLMVYAASMIEALVHQRDSYMEAHRLLSQQAKAQIAALEAELAHRDYELEQYISHCSDCPGLAKDLKTRTKLEPLPVMDPATLVKVFQRTLSRHKTLELGNKQLKRRVSFCDISVCRALTVNIFSSKNSSRLLLQWDHSQKTTRNLMKNSLKKLKTWTIPITPFEYLS